jgi:hypothetical protein
MGREIVYCWKCATRLRGEDFDDVKAYRVGDKVSCPKCVDDLIADLSAEEQESILNPPKPTRTSTQSVKKITSTQVKPAERKREGTELRRATGATARPKTGTTGTVTKVRTGTTGPVPTTGASVGAGVRKRVTSSIPKTPPPPEEAEEGEEGEEKPPMDEKKKRLLLIGGIGGGLFLLIVVLGILVLTRKPEVKHKAPDTVEEIKTPKPAAVSLESPKLKEAKALVKAAFDLKDQLGLALKKLKDAKIAAEGTSFASDVEAAIEETMAKIDKAVSAVDKEIAPAFSSADYKAVLEGYETARKLHDVSEWTDRIDTKIKLAKNRVEDTFLQFKRQIEDARTAGEDPKIEEKKAVIAKWEMPEYVEKFDKYLALINAAEPNPSKDPGEMPRTPATALKIKPLSPEMKAFMPAWQSAIGVAFNRDYAGAATEMSGAAARVESAEAKKAGAEDVDTLKAIGERYPEILKTASETPKLQTLAVEYQDKPGEWKKVTGKALKVELTRMEFKPDPVDKKEQPAIFIEFSDLNAGSLAALYKARKKTLAKKDLDLLTKFALIEGATESAQSIGGTAPDRYWLYAAEARAAAPKPNAREFEARTLFHQSEFEWRKSITKYNAIEKSKLLLSDYTSTAIVKKYQPQIAKRADTGKEFIFLPADLSANGDYNTFKMRKEDPAWVASKGIDFKDSLFNYIEAEFIALPGLTYRCWVYAGGCCQEVWNGSYQATEAVTKNKGKDASINPGDLMAAPLPMPPGLKKTHDEHKPKSVKDPKDHPKTPAKWDWISIPLPKTFLAPGAKGVRILTDQQGFAVKYIIISSSRQKAPDEATAKDLAKEASSTPPPKVEVKGAAQAKEWFLIGPFPEGLAGEQPPEKEIELGKEYQGKTAKVKWKLVSAAINGQQAVFDWDKSNTFNPKINVSVYALIHVKAPSDMDARLMISHDDGGRAWLNGTLVHDNNKSGGPVKADEFNVPIRLSEGWNRLLIKVSQATGGFGLMMRITDAAKSPIANLEYSPYGDGLEPP